MAGLRERKKLEVRDRLCDEAQKLLAIEDPDAVSVDRIAEAAGVSRATFFNYFPSKGALLDELARRMTERLHRYLESLRAEGMPLEESLVAWFALSVRTIRRSERQSRILFGRMFTNAYESDVRVTQMAEVHRAYAALIEDGRLRGELASDADVGFYAEMIAGAMTTLLGHWFNDRGYPLEARAEQTARFLAAAIRADRNRPVPTSAVKNERSSSHARIER